MVRYSFEQDHGVPEHEFVAYARADDWNGFLVPHVDKATLLATVDRFNVLAEENEGDYCVKVKDADDGGITLFEYVRPVGGNDEPIAATIVPQLPTGYYELGFGWTLVAADPA